MADIHCVLVDFSLFSRHNFYLMFSFVYLSFDAVFPMCFHIPFCVLSSPSPLVRGIHDIVPIPPFPRFRRFFSSFFCLGFLVTLLFFLAFALALFLCHSPSHHISHHLRPPSFPRFLFPFPRRFLEFLLSKFLSTFCVVKRIRR